MELKCISISCPQCSGTGTESIGHIVDDEMVYEDITCRRCLGQTRTTTMCLNDDLIDLLNDMNNKIDDILEKLNE